VRELSDRLGDFSPKYFPDGERHHGNLRTNFKLLYDTLSGWGKRNGAGAVRQLCKALFYSVTLVVIDVLDPTNGPRIFDSLNSKQQPMSIGDLVRNDIFARVAGKPAAERIHDEHWLPFYKGFQVADFDNLFEGYFFPFALVSNPNVKKSQVYPALQRQWRKVREPVKVIRSLRVYQNAYLDLVCGSNLQKLPGRVHVAFRRLQRLGCPSAVYPFLMRLSNETRKGRIRDKDALGIVNAIESFLVRRAICGYEPTGLHAVFKRLWLDCGRHVAAVGIVRAIRKHKTVSWPDDAEVKKAVIGRPLYGTRIVSYFLAEYDRSLGGDVPNDGFWIEHVLPESYSRAWHGSFSRTDHKVLRHLVANLIPLSKKMNQSLSNKGYSEKRRLYLADAMFKSARQFAAQCEDWSPDALAARGEALARWAVRRWAP